MKPNDRLELIETNQTTKATSRRRAGNGFSLVEMLVVITIIGVIAAIAVPTIGDLTAASQDSKNKRNAQNVAAIFSAALAAGGDVSGTTKVEIVDKLRAGVNGIGAFQTHTFVISGLSPTERDLALPFLRLEGTPSRLTYSKIPEP